MNRKNMPCLNDIEEDLIEKKYIFEISFLPKPKYLSVFSSDSLSIRCIVSEPTKFIDKIIIKKDNFRYKITLR